MICRVAILVFAMAALTFSYILLSASYPPLVLCIAVVGLLVAIFEVAPVWRLFLESGKRRRRYFG
jgi:hypothetical protein